MSDVRSIPIRRWQVVTLIFLQLLFAACATSVLVYRAQGWAPEVIDFGWLSYRAFNIYFSLFIIAYLVWGLLCRHRYTLFLLTIFSLFHLVDGGLIGFWTKSVVHLATLIILAWIFYRQRQFLPSVFNIER